MNETVQRDPHPAQPEAPLPLFRPQVWDTKATQWYGPIRLTQTVPAWAMASFALCVALALIAFGMFGTYTKKLAVTGITMPRGGSLTISSLAPGVIVRSYVTEGERVTRDQTLFELSGEQHVSNGTLTALLNRQLEARQQSLDDERRGRITQTAERRRGLEARLSNADAEESQLEQEIELSKRRQRLAQLTVDKFETLRASGYVSDAQLQQKMEEAIDLSSRLNALNRNLFQLRESRLALRGEQKELATNLTATLAQLDRAEAGLRQEAAENETRSRTLIKATADGVVTTITNRPGQFVAAGQVLATLIPNSANPREASDEQEVHLYVTSRAVGFANPGQAVRIRYRAFPYEKFGLYEGRILGVSQTPLAQNELPANIAGTVVSQAFSGVPSNNEGLYRIRVKPLQQVINVYGKQQHLTTGMTLEADLLLDKRPIWEWVLEPVLAFSAR